MLKNAFNLLSYFLRTSTMADSDLASVLELVHKLVHSTSLEFKGADLSENPFMNSQPI